VNLKKIAIIIFVVAAAIVLISMLPAEEKKTVQEPSQFSIKEIGKAGNSAYIIYSSVGSGKITELLLTKNASKTIYVLEQAGIENERFHEFAEKIKELEKYGFKVKVVGPAASVMEGVYIVPTGAMPAYVLNTVEFAENLTTIYLGDTNLIIRATTKKEDWYSGLDENAKARLIIVNTTVDKMSDSDYSAFARKILESEWLVGSRNETILTETGKGTKVMDASCCSYARVIYEFSDVVGSHDAELVDENLKQVYVSGDVFPWESATLDFSIEKTNGTAFLIAEKDGVVVEKEKLERVSEESYFRKNLQLDEPGEYIIKVNDNEQTVAKGIVHVKNLQVKLKDVRDIFYDFEVTVDGEPLKDSIAMVTLKNSTSAPLEYIVKNGDVTLKAKLQKDQGIFVFDILGGQVEVPVSVKKDNIFDTYARYGPIGLAVIIAIFLLARFNKKQTYLIRISDVAPEIRKEVKVTPQVIEEIFRSVRKDLRIDGPIKASEFAVGLKKYATDGADVTEGNVEEILKRVEKLGLVLNWKGYYQLAEDGIVSHNVMQRMIRETLIEKGIDFKLKGDKFIAKEVEIGFFGERFRGKGIVVFQDAEELKKTIAGLTEKERSKLFLKEFNGMLNLTTIDKLGDSL
jgi:hypothetical protein